MLSGYSLLCLLALLAVMPTGWVSAWSWERDLRWFYLLLIAFFFSSLLAPLAIRLSERLKAYDLPDPRKMHSSPMPRLGGLAVYGAVALALLRNSVWNKELAALLGGGTVIYLMGVWEDARGLSAEARLLGQSAASAIVIWGGISLTFVPDAAGGRFWEWALTAFWLIGITNALNFLDGIDGLASGMGVVCALLFILIAWPERQGHLVYAASALAGACLGFIPYNWSPAKVFLGDAGATFIGFMLAGLAVMGTWASHDPLVALTTPLLILAVPVFDTIYITLSRARRGVVRTFHEWLEYSAKDHFHHRLMKLGLTAPEAVGFILLVNLCLGLGALVIRHTGSGLGSMLLLLQTFLIFMIIVVLMLLGRDLSDS